MKKKQKKESIHQIYKIRLDCPAEKTIFSKNDKRAYKRKPKHRRDWREVE